MAEAKIPAVRRNSRRSSTDSATEVASFERHDKPPIERVQHFLHSNPGAGAADRAGAVGRDLRRRSSAAKFFSPFSLTLILQQVAIVGIVGAAQTLVILTAGIDLSVGAIMVLSLGGDGAVHLPLRHPGADLDPLRLRRRRG